MGPDASFFSYFWYMITDYQMVLATLIGAVAGVIVGFLPAFGSPQAVALLLPMTFLMPPEVALIMLGGIYFGANYGGAIPAILVNTPGTSPAFVTALDGYPLAKKGQAVKALAITNYSSLIGTIIGAILFYFLTKAVGKAALAFGPSETFALSILGLACITSIGTRSLGRSVVSLVFGLGIMTIGMDPLTTISRFTFGHLELASGISFVPAMIGLFGISEAISLFQKNNPIEKEELQEEEGIDTRGKGLTWIEHKRLFPTDLISSFIGFIVGALPGAGATIAGMISWNVAKLRSKTPERFGKGAIEGVAASESANNSASAGALVPMLALGIPGSETTAVMLGALMMHNILPGPLLLTERPALVPFMACSYIIGGIFAFIVFKLCIPLMQNFINVKKPIIAGLVFVLSVLGAYFLHNSLFDVYVVVVFGVIGFLMKQFDFPIAPVVLGLVLGKGIEANLRLALKIGGVGEVFSPISLVCLIFSFVLFVYPLIRTYQTKNPKKAM